jgi:hypothetical protein
MLIASFGHSSTHAPHSVHFFSSTFALLSSIAMASTGQTSTQIPQPMHFSWSTFAAISDLPFFFVEKTINSKMLSFHPFSLFFTAVFDSETIPF